MNGRHMRLMPNEEFEEVLVGYLARPATWPRAARMPRRWRGPARPLVKRKISTLAEYDALAGWLFGPLEIEPEAWEVLTRDVKHSIQVIGGGLGRLETLPEWTAEAVKDALQDQLHVMGEAARDFLEPQRIAITGRLVSTGIYESLALLGREEAFARYRETLGRLAEHLGHGVMLDRAAQRTLMLAAGVLFGGFAVVAFVFRRQRHLADSTLSIVGGVMAYAFLAVDRAWSCGAAGAGRGTDAGRRGQALRLAPSGRGRDRGRPRSTWGRPRATCPPAGAAAQANLVVPVSGPGGRGAASTW